jgi:hypothetical protein
MLLMSYADSPGVPPMSEWAPAAKVVTHDGAGAPVVTDGPFAESKELLAGYWLVDVASEERAIQIAARTSAAPGPGGAPMAKEIQVRPVMHRPGS